MKNVVNPAPFVEYRQLIEKLSSVEALFKDIENLPSATAEAGTRVPVSARAPFCVLRSLAAWPYIRPFLATLHPASL